MNDNNMPPYGTLIELRYGVGSNEKNYLYQYTKDMGGDEGWKLVGGSYAGGAIEATLHRMFRKGEGRIDDTQEYVI